MDKNEFNSALLDVRKAYRLLYLYQRRILDLVSFIGDRLSIEFKEGWSYFSNTARTGSRVHLDRWAWDWLSMYFYEFYFGQIITNYYFALVLQNDSGFFEMDNVSKLDVEKFLPVEKSQTRLIFYCVFAETEIEHPIDVFLIDDLGDGKKSEFIKGGKSGPLFVAKAYDLERFFNGESTVEAIDDYIAFAESTFGCSLFKKFR